ncbi:MAG: hypothetical protein LBB57_04120, partial [Clostridiales Family XIII bacterium]|nr:hypothetical protein [Clostridiales Family XIII bacterium]
MSMNLSKRAACLIAAAALILSPVAPALAAETDGLEAAILLVKGLADVPESMEDFNYHIFEDETRDYAVYNLNWSDGGERGAVNAEVANGKLTSLYRNYLGEAQTGLGSVSRETARRTA